jgi:hypothetical protein
MMIDVPSVRRVVCPDDDAPRAPPRRGPDAEGAKMLGSVLCRWPADFPFTSWQIWDPEVPHTMVMSYSKFAPQPGLAINEVFGGGGGDDVVGLFMTVAATAGQELAAVGGLVVHPGDDRVPGAVLAVTIPQPAAHPDRPPPAMVLVVSNEVQTVRRGKGAAVGVQQMPLPEAAAASNATLRLARDPLGFVYVALVALTDIESWSEIFL